VVGRLTDLSEWSIVIPVLNEQHSICQSLRSIQHLRHRGAELILVDGHSEDKTGELGRPLVDKVCLSKPGRALQMNSGVEHSGRHCLCFLHVDTLFPEDVADQFNRFQSSTREWGRFDVQLSGDRPIFKLISLMVNLRSRLTAIATGDQAIFVTRSAFDSVGGYPDIPLMEDIAFSKALKKRGRPLCVGSPVVTSSRRWEEFGVWRTVFLMWKLRWQFFRGVPPEKLHKQYYAKKYYSSYSVRTDERMNEY